mgnify:CR=1 FL=1
MKYLLPVMLTLSFSAFAGTEWMLGEQVKGSRIYDRALIIDNGDKTCDVTINDFGPEFFKINCEISEQKVVFGETISHKTCENAQTQSLFLPKNYKITNVAPGKLILKDLEISDEDMEMIEMNFPGYQESLRVPTVLESQLYKVHASCPGLDT